MFTSSKGARDAIAKWGEFVQIFGNIGNVDCPCKTLCKNEDGYLKFNQVVNIISLLFREESGHFWIHLRHPDLARKSSWESAHARLL